MCVCGCVYIVGVGEKKRKRPDRKKQRMGGCTLFSSFFLSSFLFFFFLFFSHSLASLRFPAGQIDCRILNAEEWVCRQAGKQTYAGNERKENNQTGYCSYLFLKFLLFPHTAHPPLRIGGKMG
ncbi:hypothetical protein ABW19_dt0207110 [Dactylella cylindrospora]|nr:hypothetical protein ABW19_dt0207110 [Dactylella cylindrospora]